MARTKATRRGVGLKEIPRQVARKSTGGTVPVRPLGQNGPKLQT